MKRNLKPHIVGGEKNNNSTFWIIYLRKHTTSGCVQPNYRNSRKNKNYENKDMSHVKRDY